MSETPKKAGGLLQIIEATPAVQLPAVPQIANRFKELYLTIHGGDKQTEASIKKAKAFYEAEKFHFMKMIQESKKLQECSKMSLYGCFIDVAVNGLSFDPSFKHLYLVPFNVNIGTQQNPKWEKRAQLQIAGPGELVLRIKQNQIKYADNPTLVYDGDTFSFGTKNGSGFVEHSVVLPRKSDTIIAAYVKITRIDDSVDYKVITQEDMDRFRKFSKDPNSKAWVDGIGGMWLSKCIKHAFKNYPKVRSGEFSQLQTQTEDTEAEVMETKPGSMNVPKRIDYIGESHDDVFEQSDTGGSDKEVDDESFTKADTPDEKIVNVGGDDDTF